MRPRDFQKLVERMRGTPEEKPIAFLMLRTMQKARYDPSNLGHFGLAADELHPLHVADPPLSRPGRPPHAARVAARAMTEERRERADRDLPEMARHTSERERRADDAERELVQWKKVRFMADKVGDEFDGYITGVSAFGLYIELVEHFVEGMVHISTMADDYYRFVEGRTCSRARTPEGVPARRRVSGAGDQGGHGAAADRLGMVEILDAVRDRRRNRGRAASRAEPRVEAASHARRPTTDTAAGRRSSRKPRPGRQKRRAAPQGRR